MQLLPATLRPPVTLQSEQADRCSSTAVRLGVSLWYKREGCIASMQHQPLAQQAVPAHGTSSCTSGARCPASAAHCIL
jgi:hypothetical protein